MPYARQWEVMTKTTIIGATHNMASDFFSYWRFFMAEVPNQQEDLGQGAQPGHLLFLTFLVLSLVYIVYVHMLCLFAILLLILFGLTVCILACPRQQRLLMVGMFLGDQNVQV